MSLPHMPSSSTEGIAPVLWLSAFSGCSLVTDDAWFWSCSGSFFVIKCPNIFSFLHEEAFSYICKLLVLQQNSWYASGQFLMG